MIPLQPGGNSAPSHGEAASRNRLHLNESPRKPSSPERLWDIVLNTDLLWQLCGDAWKLFPEAGPRCHTLRAKPLNSAKRPSPTDESYSWWASIECHLFNGVTPDLGKGEEVKGSHELPGALEEGRKPESQNWASWGSDLPTDVFCSVLRLLKRNMNLLPTFNDRRVHIIVCISGFI